MKELTYSLLADGSSDKALLYPLTWLLRQLLPGTAINALWADLRGLPEKPKDLSDRIVRTIQAYPCQLLFIHRDAEKDSLELRKAEIHAAISQLCDVPHPIVCVVPVRMMEAWFLFSEEAIRLSAGNDSGVIELCLPKLAAIEDLADPKELLYSLLRTASELKGRRLQKFRPPACVHRLAECIDDFAPLRQLAAFQDAEQQTRTAIELLNTAQKTNCP